jgi:hypothetical protein
MEETMTKEEKRELEAILDHHIIYSKETDTYSLQTDSVSEYTRLKPHQGLSEALTNFINRVQLRWGGDAFEEIRRLGDRELTKIHAVEEGE